MGARFRDNPAPRTAVGLSKDSQYLYLLTIDGRQQGYSDGADHSETSAWLLLLGAYVGFNLDGGGSTTMVMESSTGTAVRLNKSSAVADSGRERTVGSHFGVYAKPLLGFINDIVARPDDESASVTWTTRTPATSQVEFGITADLGEVSAIQSLQTTNHAVLLRHLRTDTQYYFRVISSVGSTRYSSATLAFTTTNYVTTQSVMELT